MKKCGHTAIAKDINKPTTDIIQEIKKAHLLPEMVTNGVVKTEDIVAPESNNKINKISEN